MGAIASQSTILATVFSTVYSDADQRKHQSSASLAFVRGIHRQRPVNPPHKWPVTRKWFHLMTSSWLVNYFCWYRWQCIMNSEDTRICTLDKNPWNKYTYFVCVVHKSDTRYLNKIFVLDISISCPWCYFPIVGVSGSVESLAWRHLLVMASHFIAMSQRFSLATEPTPAVHITGRFVG